MKGEKRMQYKTIFASDVTEALALSKLRKELEKYMKDGWRPIGGMLKAGDETENMVCQTIIK